MAHTVDIGIELKVENVLCCTIGTVCNKNNAVGNSHVIKAHTPCQNHLNDHVRQTAVQRDI